ncbi:MAG: thiamine diphosphokinase [Clostridia bacterium]|jgi:thiamine pyrophosphokinase|nr:thiamine diphosphokinase [Clostridia bacterium]MCI1999095.1 thiamine diphosphokinase [Clostridia bacterium]MCI2013845.1 thiamine diphosphokinase [Clostridia bacterium]
MKAVVFGGADIKDYSFCKKYINAYIVACDGGMSHCMALKIKPNVIVGDFDSARDDVLEYYRDKKIPIKQFPCRKDETDMELGLEAAIEAGADDITIIGGIGSRLDHTMANCQLLYILLKKGIKAKIVNENNEIRLIDKDIAIEGHKGDIVSLIPMTENVCGVTTKNLEYPLNDAKLNFGSRLIAVSNVMTSDRAFVSIKSGLLYVMKCHD